MNEHKVNVLPNFRRNPCRTTKRLDAVIKDFSDKDPFFKTIVDSQKAYAKKVMKYLLMNQPNYRLAYENEFGPVDKVKI